MNGRTLVIALAWVFTAAFVVLALLEWRSPDNHDISNLLLFSFVGAILCDWIAIARYRARCPACGAPYPLLYAQWEGYIYSGPPYYCDSCGNLLVSPGGKKAAEDLRVPELRKPYSPPSPRAKLLGFVFIIFGLGLVYLISSYLSPAIRGLSDRIPVMAFWFGSGGFVWLGGKLLARKHPWPQVGFLCLFIGGCLFMALAGPSK